MLTVYGNDAPVLGRDDWEDALGTGAFPAYADWEHADWSRPVAFLVDDTEGTVNLPVREFAVDLEHECAEPIGMTDELAYILDDIAGMKAIMRQLYALKPYDWDVRGRMETAQWAFSEAYDRALAKAMRMIIMEAYRKRGE